MKKRIFYWSCALAGSAIGLLGLLGGVPLRAVNATPVTYSKTLTVLPSDCAETSASSDNSHYCYQMINGIKVRFYTAQVHRENVGGVDYLQFKPTANGVAVFFAAVDTNAAGAHGTGYTKMQVFDETSLRVGAPSVSVGFWDTSDSKGTGGVYTCTVSSLTSPPQLMVTKGSGELFASKIIVTYGCTSGS